jgi:hypothetical protein
MNMCVVKFINLFKYQRGLIFNGFRPNSQRWKYAVLTNIFYRIRICSFFIHLPWRTYHSTDKSLIFPNMQSNSDTIARWCSITFFYTPCIVLVPCADLHIRSLSSEVMNNNYRWHSLIFPPHTNYSISWTII